MHELPNPNERKSRFSRKDYEVDTRRVAAAIIAKLAMAEDGRTLPPVGDPSRGADAGSPLRPAA
jgi:hypothetical protein